MLLGYARAGSRNHALESQIEALIDTGISPERIYTDTVDRISTLQRRPGFTALLDYARPGDIAVVVGIDRLGRSTTEVMATTRDLGHRQIGLRSLREGIDTDDPAGAMIVGVLASLAELAEGDSRKRRHGSHRSSTESSTSPVGRPRVLDDDQVAFALRRRAEGRPVPTIAEELGVSRATLYRTLAERRSVR
ncbi:recombinase family protein [Gordonia sp. CPCC 205515]|uniref:recombinase family protein n=1 Tax=Gordonia sp. CPCC 205515 TaxID=3140791 RepID=UPI003AF3CFE5